MALWSSWKAKRAAAREDRQAKEQAAIDKQLAASACEGKWADAHRLFLAGAKSGTLSKGHSALFWAAKANNVMLVEALAPSAHWNAEDRGQNALMAACAGGHEQAAKILMLTQARMEEDDRGVSALGFATASGNVGLAKALLHSDSSGWSPGKNQRWEAAKIAAGLHNRIMLDVLSGSGWSQQQDQSESWKSDKFEHSLASAAIRGAPDFTSCHWDSMMSLWIEQGQIPRALEFRRSRAEKCSLEMLHQALKIDQATGAPDMGETWILQVFSLSVTQSAEAALFLLDNFPELPLASWRNGETALMAALDAGSEEVCRRLIPLSDLSAKGSRESSMLMRSILGSGKYSTTNPAVFAQMARSVDAPAWAQDEDCAWRAILTSPPGHWKEPEILLAAHAAARRSSAKALSSALSLAVAQGHTEVAKLLFGMTRSEDNLEAFAQEFLRRCSGSEEMAKLVEQRMAALRESEAIERASSGASLRDRRPAKRL